MSGVYFVMEGIRSYVALVMGGAKTILVLILILMLVIYHTFLDLCYTLVFSSQL